MKAVPRSESLRSDTDQTVRFVNHFHPQGPWHVVAIIEGRVVGRPFHDKYSLERWIEQHQGKANLYFHVNRLKRTPTKGKATKADVECAIALHLDVDNPAREILDRIQSFRPSPSITTFSGGGYQA